ncbi:MULTISPECIES: hypothetical protein [unclassified Crossiella]|uniref:hypothetical protein n=1 Tax=unclassified Crossiella TaxID=2620835 RepID=UPI001FFF2733|nr:MULTISPECIES: hypothetical protein [unclassified Crossiella]MCK2242313.1 hypothetical protein [Crossiella sp. S99.2]MCK2254656.1 hypothetical protein [Crossiella sp. S99.1]
MDEADRRTLYSVVISAGGLTVQDLGGIKQVDRDGDTVFFVGGGTGAFTRPDGSPQPISYLADDRGRWRIAVFDPNPNLGDYRQFVAIYDYSGNIILGDDVESGTGLARPYVPLSVSDSHFSRWPGTDRGEWTTLSKVRLSNQHPRLSIDARHTTDQSATTGEIRLWGRTDANPGGTQLGETKQVVFAEQLGGWTVPAVGRWAEMAEVWLQARRTGGTGTVRACIAYASGVQS